MKTNLIPNDYSRCNNLECQKRMICNRFLQLEVDAQTGAGFRSVTSFNEDKCANYIEHDDNN